MICFSWTCFFLDALSGVGAVCGRGQEEAVTLETGRVSTVTGDPVACPTSESNLTDTLFIPAGHGAAHEVSLQ